MSMASTSPRRAAVRRTSALDGLLVAAAIGVVALFIVVPLVYVFHAALADGVRGWWAALVRDPDTRHAIWLSLTVAPVAVAINVVFGIAAAWLPAPLPRPRRPQARPSAPRATPRHRAPPARAHRSAPCGG